MGQIQPGKQELVPIELTAGFVSDMTQYAAGGRWWDGDGIRFRKSYPEKIGGWTRLLAATWRGVCRNLFTWSDLTTRVRLALGTSQRALVYDTVDYSLIDITPVTANQLLGNNPFSATNGSPIITVNHTAHGRVTNDFARFTGATAFAGFTALALNREYQITVLSPNQYTITLLSNATGTATGGGAAVNVQFVFEAFSGLSGWGAGAWGEGGWGTSPALTLATAEVNLWSFDNWGEDLLLNARGLGIYYYDVTFPTTPAVNITLLPGATDAPASAIQIVVDSELRFAIALGASPIGMSVRDPMFIRWADRGSITNWSVGPASTAGGFRLAAGSRIMCGVKTRRELLVFTDTTLYTLQATGGTSIFRPSVVAQNTSLVGPNAQAVDQSDVTYWMAKGGFYRYNGRVEPIICDVSDRIFNDINYGSAANIVCGSNPKFDEMWWLYPSLNATENDRYAVYNYVENVWTTGTVVKKTAWLSSPIFDNPLTAGLNGLYLHEAGYDDCDLGPATPLNSYIYSAPTEVDDGNQVLSVDRIVPDISFGTTPSAFTPQVTFTLASDDWPGSMGGQNQSRTSIAGVKSGEVRAFTDRLDIRVRGRKFGLRVDNNQLGVFWRLGRQRVRIKLDGQR